MVTLISTLAPFRLLSNNEIPTRGLKHFIVFIIDEDTVWQTIYDKESRVKVGDSIILPLGEKEFAIVLLESRKGDAYVKLIDSNGIVRKEGRFVSGKGFVFKEYYLWIDVDAEGSFYWDILKFYQPLRDGNWIYRDSMGNLIKEESWLNGLSSDMIYNIWR